MGSVNMDCDTKRELDDSGCVQDVTLSNGQVSLLDISDDVLLYVLRYCSPRDLKALGYSCSRLGRLVQERALWRRVDARSEACSKARLCWFLDNTLHDDTKVLMISGYAKAAEGCLGLINVSREEAEEERKQNQREGPSSAPSNISEIPVSEIPEELHQIPIPVHLERHHARFFVTAQRTTHLPRFRGFPSWPDSLGRRGPQPCRGPQFSLSQPLLQRLGDTCPRLTTLAVDYCNIDCNTTNLSNFPRTLKKLSLRGSKCYNMTIDKSFLFKIQDYLPVLESLDVSECEWMDPATLLPLSKLATLEELFMRDCHKLAEFVAYASLTARYGFRTLKVLDLRGSPVGDSEVSALGWLPRLERLWLSAAHAADRHAHAHYAGDARTIHTQLHAWERTEPDCFKSRSNSDTEDITMDDVEEVSPSEGSVDSNRTSILSSSGVKEKENNKRKKESNEEFNTELHSKRQKVSENSVNENNGKINNDNKINDTDNDSKNNDDKASKSNDNDDKASKSNDNDNKDSKSNDNDDKASKSNDNDNKDSKSNDNDNKDSKNNDNDDKGSKSNDNDDKASKSNDNKNQEEQRHRNSPDCIVDCIKIDQLIDVGELRRGRQNEVIVIANSAKVRCPSGSRHQDSYVCFRRNQNPVYVDVDNQEGRNNVNEGASTSKEKKEENNDTENDENDNSDTENNDEKYVHFRKNRDPVYVNCAPEEQNQRREPPPVQYQIEPRHHVLYVSVGPQINTYRFPRDTAEMERQINLNFMPSHVDSSSLVTDFAIRRFGRADGEDVNIIHIGPNGPMVVGQANGSRPDRSNLRFLSVTGYRNITDRSLVHLASAAPNLTFIDFSETNVSEAGADTFRSLRPDCELVFSPFVDKKDK